MEGHSFESDRAGTNRIIDYLKNVGVDLGLTGRPIP
jgi:hypothetical protein